MFSNRRFDQQPFVIGIAMAAEAWRYAEFHRANMPASFLQTSSWMLPLSDWSPIFYWGTPDSDNECEVIAERMRTLILECGISQVY